MTFDGAWAVPRRVTARLAGVEMGLACASLARGYCEKSGGRSHSPLGRKEPRDGNKSHIHSGRGPTNCYQSG
jgi:hypothetical protein